MEGAESKSYRGHSEHVVRLKFSQDGKYLISAGGYDQTIIQWKREGEETEEESEAYLTSESEDIDEEEQKYKMEAANSGVKKNDSIHTGKSFILNSGNIFQRMTWIVMKK